MAVGLSSMPHRIHSGESARLPLLVSGNDKLLHSTTAVVVTTRSALIADKAASRRFACNGTTRRLSQILNSSRPGRSRTSADVAIPSRTLEAHQNLISPLVPSSRCYIEAARRANASRPSQLSRVRTVQNRYRRVGRTASVGGEVSVVDEAERRNDGAEDGRGPGEARNGEVAPGAAARIGGDGGSLEPEGTESDLRLFAFPADGSRTSGLGEGRESGDGTNALESEGSGLAKFAKGVRDFVTSNFLLVAISTGICLAVLHPAPGIYAQSKIGLSRYCTFGIFFVSGIALDLEELRRVASAWPAFLYGTLSTLAITPLMALLVLRLPLLPRELPTGLALFCCMPATITAGISLARAAGANTALALGLTVVTNTVGILTMPLLLSRLVPASGGVSVPAGPLLRSLVTTLLVPLVIGMTARRAVPAVARWADQRKQQLSMANNAMLSFVPWMQVSSARAAILRLDVTQLLPIAVAGIAVHVSFLALNITMMAVLRRFTPPLPPQEANAVDRAVIILSSQKTLPVAATVVEKVGALMGEPALVLLPCILTHFLQIFIDSLLVNKWLKDDRQDSTEARKLAAKLT